MSINIEELIYDLAVKDDLEILQELSTTTFMAICHKLGIDTGSKIEVNRSRRSLMTAIEDKLFGEITRTYKIKDMPPHLLVRAYGKMTKRKIKLPLSNNDYEAILQDMQSLMIKSLTLKPDGTWFGNIAEKV